MPKHIYTPNIVETISMWDSKETTNNFKILTKYKCALKIPSDHEEELNENMYGFYKIKRKNL
jgi:hypothetical protein